MNLIKCLFLCICIIVCSHSQYAFAQAINFDVPKGPIIIRGDYLKAAIVAGNECQKYLDKLYRTRKAKGLSGPLDEHIRDIGNYSVSIQKTDNGDTFEVHFAPLLFQGSPIKGGGTTYFIDCKSFKILKTEKSM